MSWVDATVRPSVINAFRQLDIGSCQLFAIESYIPESFSFFRGYLRSGLHVPILYSLVLKEKKKRNSNLIRNVYYHMEEPSLTFIFWKLFLSNSNRSGVVHIDFELCISPQHQFQAFDGYALTGINFEEIYTNGSTGLHPTPNRYLFGTKWQLLKLLRLLCIPMRQFSLFIFPLSQKWVSSLKIIWLENVVTSWNLSRGHREKRCRGGQSSGLCSSTSYILYAFNLRSRRKIHRVVWLSAGFVYTYVLDVVYSVEYYPIMVAGWWVMVLQIVCSIGRI